MLARLQMQIGFARMEMSAGLAAVKPVMRTRSVAPRASAPVRPVARMEAVAAITPVAQV